MTQTSGAGVLARCRELGQSKDPGELRFLVSCLEAPDRGVQDAAFDALRGMPARPVLEAVLPLLRHRNERVRNLAREILGPLGGSEPGPVLPYLADPDPNVRIFAVEILESWRDPAFVKALEPLAAQGPANVRNQVAISLGKTGLPQALPLLSRLLRDDEEWVRFAAEEALEELAKIKGRNPADPRVPAEAAPPDPRDIPEAKPAEPGPGRTVAAAPIPLSEPQFKKLRDFIYLKSGLHFAEAKKYLLESRLGGRIASLGLKGPDEYHAYLTGDPGAPEELVRLFEAVTNNETSFFRTIQQFHLFTDVILPQCLGVRKAAGSKTLRFWSAGCSTGEEPYSLAMVLRERLGPDLAGRELKILAHDLSVRALELARTGRYPEAALRPVPPDLRARYFSPQEGGAWLLDSRVKSLVDFQHQNLSTLAPDKAPRDMDAIFCRNVMMYFDAESKKRVLGRFYDALRPGGYLVVGATESLHGVTRAFRMVVHDHAVVYQKEDSR